MAYPDFLKRRGIELGPGRSAGEVRRTLVREFPDADIPDERTIRRWVQKGPAPLPAAEPKATKVQENWTGHFEQRTAVAKGLLANNLANVFKADSGVFKKGVYFTGVESGSTQYFPREQLTGQLWENFRLTIRDCGDWFVDECFLTHLDTELPEDVSKEGYWDGIMLQKPYELVEIMRLMVARGTFKGTCSVCKDW